jgi:hypothetical protein
MLVRIAYFHRCNMRFWLTFFIALVLAYFFSTWHEKHVIEIQPTDTFPSATCIPPVTPTSRKYTKIYVTVFLYFSHSHAAEEITDLKFIYLFSGNNVIIIIIANYLQPMYSPWTTQAFFSAALFSGCLFNSK